MPPRGYEKSWPLRLLLVNARDLRMAHRCLPRQQQAAGDVKQRAECWLNSAQPGVSIIDLRPQAAEVYRTRSWAARTSAGTPLIFQMHATIMVVMSNSGQEA